MPPTDRELFEKALEDICAAKLCEFNSMSSRHEMIRLLDKAITALRERLEQPEQCKYPDCKCATENPCLKGMAQPQRTHWEGCEQVHPECKKPEQEPVAHTLNCVCGAVWDVSPDGVEEMVHAPNPPQRKPLTDEEALELWNKHEKHWRFENNALAFTRAIEAAHGIKEQS